MTWVIGIDFGMKHWGLARGIYGIIEPIGAIDAVGGIPNFSELHALLRPWNSGQWVVGYPLDGEGEPLPLARALTRHWSFLQKKLGGTITAIDEFFTTKEAQQLLSYHTNITRHKKNHIDSLSACLILQRYYDSQP